MCAFEKDSRKDITNYDKTMCDGIPAFSKEELEADALSTLNLGGSYQERNWSIEYID